MITVADYPVLKELLWDMHVTNIEEKDAFYYYETRWGYIRTEDITRKEMNLIKNLTQEYGKGFMLVP